MADKTMVNVAFPTELLQKIDAKARERYSSRSDYIRQTIVKSIERDGEDEFTPEVIAQMAEELDAHIKVKGFSDEDLTRMAKETRREIYAEQQRKDIRRS